MLNKFIYFCDQESLRPVNTSKYVAFLQMVHSSLIVP